MLERRSLYGGLLLLALIATCTGQIGPCATLLAQESCDSCITTSPDCFWCPYTPCENSTLTNTVMTHCYNRNSSFICPEPEVDPPSVVTNIEDAELFNESTSEGPSVQVRPQVVRMQLRQGSPQSFNMSFIALRNTPLDVYFLLDSSGSLVDVFAALRDNLEDIANSIGQISSAYRIGIGGFVDKNVFPYAGSSSYYFMQNDGELNCRQNLNTCGLPFGYRHYLSLTDNITAFQEAVNNNSNLSVNADIPEAGLDALLQVAVCTDIIGWRSDALRMVFLITDAPFHIAGDGYLSGLVRPNDGLCHMTKISGDQYEYTYSHLQDYPSIFQVLDALEEQVIVPIFVFQESNPEEPPGTDIGIRVYESLANIYQNIQAQAIPIAAVDASSNVTTAQLIIDLINQAYENTSQTIQVIIPSIEGYTITVEPTNCAQVAESGGCRVSFDDIITFNVTVELTDCSTASSQTISLRGAPYVFSTIQVEPVCGCNCSQTRDDSSECCSGIGSLVCGRCDCNSEETGRFGYQCQCDSDAMTCPMFGANDEDPVPCGGLTRGACTGCGSCVCNPPYFGPEFGCRCDSESCASLSNCNNQGTCQCGDNPTCDCTERAPVSGELYFGDSCQCNPDDCFNSNWNYQGMRASLCQVAGDPNSSGMCSRASECPGCQCGVNITGIPNLQSSNGLCIPTGLLCDFFIPCVSCAIIAGGTDPDCPSPCSSHPSYELRNDDLEFESSAYVSTRCTAPVGTCRYEFVYGRNVYGVPVLILQSNPDCDGLPFFAPYAIAAGIVLLIILLGLLILCLLKICFVLWDKKEYGKFTAELQHADFAPHENPLYLTPQQDYPNPILRRHSSKRSK